MAISASSYGTTAGVANLTKVYSNGAGDFDEATDPTISVVESWIDQISGILNKVLANQGESTPVTDSDTVLMLDFFVNQETAALVLGRHNQGRFGPTAKNPQGGRFDLIYKDAVAFVDTIVTTSNLPDEAVATAVTRTDGFS